MTFNKEVKAKIQAEKILEALTIAISEAIEIEVTTIYTSEDLDKINPSSSESRLHTRLNLLDGTVDHEIDLKLIDNPVYDELQRLHIEQVEQRQASLIEKLTSLAKMRNICMNLNLSSDK